MICDNCPESAALDIAEKIISDSGSEHSQPEKALGAITLNRRILEALSETLDCNGPCMNQNQQLDCPLRDKMLETRGLATALWPQNQFAVDLENFRTEGKGSLSQSTGQYL